MQKEEGTAIRGIEQTFRQARSTAGGLASQEHCNRAGRKRLLRRIEAGRALDFALRMARGNGMPEQRRGHATERAREARSGWGANERVMRTAVYTASRLLDCLAGAGVLRNHGRLSCVAVPGGKESLRESRPVFRGQSGEVDGVVPGTEGAEAQLPRDVFVPVSGGSGIRAGRDTGGDG
jgi:hypothetical protein